MKFTKPFQGVPDGQIYPVQYEAGQECPPELLDSATALEAIAMEEQPQGQADELAPAPAARPGRTAKAK